MKTINLSASENKILSEVLNVPVKDLSLSEIMKRSPILEKVEKLIEGENYVDGTIEFEDLEINLILEEIKGLTKIPNVLVARIITSIKNKLETE